MLLSECYSVDYFLYMDFDTHAHRNIAHAQNKNNKHSLEDCRCCLLLPIGKFFFFIYIMPLAAFRQVRKQNDVPKHKVKYEARKKSI